MRVPEQKFFVPANNMAIAGTKNFCPGTRMARSYKHGTSALQVNQSGFNSAS
jgi:hypothetical protein